MPDRVVAALGECLGVIWPELWDIDCSVGDFPAGSLVSCAPTRGYSFCVSSEGDPDGFNLCKVDSWSESEGASVVSDYVDVKVNGLTVNRFMKVRRLLEHRSAKYPRYWHAMREAVRVGPNGGKVHSVVAVDCESLPSEDVYESWVHYSWISPLLNISDKQPVLTNTDINLAETKSRGPGVYFAQEMGTRFVKVGHCGSHGPHERLRELSTGNPRQLVLIGFIPAYTLSHANATERKTHKTFRGSRIRGEWFVLGDWMYEWLLTEKYLTSTYWIDKSVVKMGKA